MAEVLRAASERHVELSGGGDSGEPLKAKLITWPEDWHSASKVTLEAVFGTRTPGEEILLDSRLRSLDERTSRPISDLVINMGLMSVPENRGQVAALFWGILISTFVIIIPSIFAGLPFWWIAGPMLVSILSLAVFYGLLMRWRKLSFRGQIAYRYLQGLRVFLAASEAQRMRAVQGADSSLRVGPDAKGPIFEKLLPYAVALGLEDSWQKAAGATFKQDLEISWLPERSFASFQLDVPSFGFGSRRRRWGVSRQPNLSSVSARIILQLLQVLSRVLFIAAILSRGGRASSGRGGGGGGGGGRLG